MKKTLLLLVLCLSLSSCGDSISSYITSIKNNTEYEIVVHLSEDIKITCESHQETIIEDNSGSSVKKYDCRTPYVFTVEDTKIIIENGTMLLTKDILDDKNWECTDEEDWSLIMVGNYYSKITATFVIDNEDVKVGVE